MKRLSIFILLFYWIVQFSIGQQRIIYSNYSTNDIVIDGLETENDWILSDSISFDGVENKSENTVVVKSLWDEDYLYFLFKVSDTNLQSHQVEQDHPKLFLDDMVEFLIDAANHKDSCWNESKIVYHINLSGIKKDDRGSTNCFSDPSWNGNANYSVKLFGTLNDTNDSDEGYMVEVAIPWSELLLIPHENKVLGVNFANGDNDCNGRQLFDWVGAFPLRSPHLFGNLVLRQ